MRQTEVKDVFSEVEIQASAERVWEMLTDFASYPEWNPCEYTIEKILDKGLVILGTEDGFGTALAHEGTFEIHFIKEENGTKTIPNP